MFGLTEETILKMLEKNIPTQPKNELAQFIRNYLIPNIVAVVAADNEAILFDLETERTKDDSDK